MITLSKVEQGGGGSSSSEHTHVNAPRAANREDEENHVHEALLRATNAHLPDIDKKRVQR